LEGLPKRGLFADPRDQRDRERVLRRGAGGKGGERALSLGMAESGFRRLRLARGHFGGRRGRNGRARVEQLDAHATHHPAGGREAGTHGRRSQIGWASASSRLSGGGCDRSLPGEYEGEIPARPNVPDHGVSRTGGERGTRTVAT